MRRLLPFILALQVGTTGFVDAIPPIVGNEQTVKDNGQPWGLVGMTGQPCKEQDASIQSNR